MLHDLSELRNLVVMEVAITPPPAQTLDRKYKQMDDSQGQPSKKEIGEPGHKKEEGKGFGEGPQFMEMATIALQRTRDVR